jgi:hypothetical protein
MTQPRLWLESTVTVDTESAVAGLQGPVAGDAKLQLGHTWNKQITAREKREKVDDKFRDSHQERK